MPCKIVLRLLLGALVVVSTYGQQWSWEPIGVLPHGISFFDVAVLSPSRVLVIGGMGTSTTAFNTCSIVDVDQWTISPAAALSVGRSQFASTVMPDGHVYVFGGYQHYPNGGVALVERYDPTTDRWESAGELTQGRAQLCVTPISEEEILVVGGRIGVGEVVATCEIYNVATRTTRRVADYPYVTSFANVFRTREGRILSCGGREGGPGSARYPDVYEYLVAANAWVRAGTMEDNIYRPSLLTTTVGNEWLIGGSWEENNTGPDAYARTVMRRRGGDFIAVASLLQERCGPGVAQIGPRQAVIVGGLNNQKESLTTCEFLDLETGSVTKAPSTNAGHAFFRAIPVMFRGRPGVLAISGDSEYGEASPLVEILLRSQCEMVAPGIGDVSLAGSAVTGDQGIRLTEPRTYQRGAVWYRNSVDVRDGFRTYFAVRVSEGNDSNQLDGYDEGADGFTLVLQDHSLSAVGDGGQGIGYSGIRGVLAIEFDAYLNRTVFDPSGSHVAVQIPIDGILTAAHRPECTVALADLVPPIVADGSTYHCWVEYGKGLLRVWMSADGWMGEPTITVPLDLPDGRAWMGITSSTGYSVQQHELVSWTITTCDPIPVSVDDEPTMSGTGTQAVPRIVPQPTSDEAQLEVHMPVSGGMVVVSSMRGEELQRIPLQAGTNAVSLAAHALASGTYVVRCISADGVQTILWSVVHD